ncbi:hypothetical protein C4D60_Mb04t27740 [Musa balbisiana]|uniref:Uncharacterized protein n=1 Tax=Musa balbisiana TaxID=52838 RepID=A0A4S8KF49_MUSBA|nr:hypothetical protein C4D60_Mb04t27740 [Musa balbisiana]
MENGSSSYRRHNPSPALVSTGCSGFKSYLSLCRPPPAHRQPPSLDAHPQPPAREPSLCGDGEAAAQAYWRRARQLEQELRKLDMWLSTEKRLTVCLKNSPAVKTENGRAEMARLADGSYENRPAVGELGHASFDAIDRGERYDCSGGDPIPPCIAFVEYIQ